ncbi:MAG: hypothetical protein JWN81_1075 [Solirubrobacterales bacterium]|nr:hypothetical protein [Solirubrobacterales bacterium]
MSAGRSGAARTACSLLALASCWTAVPGAFAQAPTAAIRAAFRPDAPAARTAFTFAFTLKDPEAGVPAALRTMVVHLPAGLGFDLGGVASCGLARVQGSGPAGCPARSLVGRGHALLEVHAGSQSIPEEAVLSVLRAPDRGGHPALAIFGQGETPLQQRTISTAMVLADRAPYGAELKVSIPPIPTVVYEPDASILSFSLTIGGPGAHGPGAIRVPRHCPAGGFPFAAQFTFADQSRAAATAHVPCPHRG